MKTQSHQPYDALLAAWKAEFDRAQQATESELFMKKVSDLDGVDPSQFVNRKERRAHMKKVRSKTQGTQP